MALRIHSLASVLLAALLGILLGAMPADAQQDPPSLPVNELPTPPNATSDDNTPSSAIIVLPPGVRPAVDLNDNPAARARIADMLQRAQQNLRLNATQGSPNDQPSSSDPILSDVLDVIRRQGSVLDGSSLDEAPATDMPQDAADSGDSGDLPLDPKLEGDRRYQVAESLLRSARLLQQLGSADPEQTQLIRAMRHRALALMIQSAASEKTSQPLHAPSH